METGRGAAKQTKSERGFNRRKISPVVRVSEGLVQLGGLMVICISLMFSLSSSLPFIKVGYAYKCSVCCIGEGVSILS